MSTLLVVNMVASGTMVLGFTAFLIFLFGRENSLVHKLEGMCTVCVKGALATCAAGSLYNMMTLSEPPPSEVVLNVGVAALFAWAAWFHWVRFVRGGGRVDAKVAKKAARRRKAA